MKVKELKKHLEHMPETAEVSLQLLGGFFPVEGATLTANGAGRVVVLKGAETNPEDEVKIEPQDLEIRRERTGPVNEPVTRLTITHTPTGITASSEEPSLLQSSAKCIAEIKEQIRERRTQ